MAGRPLNRRGLRRQVEQAEQQADQTPETPETPVKAEKVKAPRKTAPRKPSVRKPRAPKVAARMRVRWCIYDGGMKPVALFDYNQRAAADARLADLQGRSKGVYFLRLFKDAIPQPPEAMSVK